MKRPKPDLQNTRILRLAKQFVSLPFVLAAGVYGWVKGLLLKCKSDKQLRADDQLRQSRARRELRGLPSDHAPESPAAN